MFSRFDGYHTLLISSCSQASTYSHVMTLYQLCELSKGEDFRVLHNLTAELKKARLAYFGIPNVYYEPWMGNWNSKTYIYAIW